jgi:hypothetical protein
MLVSSLFFSGCLALAHGHKYDVLMPQNNKAHHSCTPKLSQSKPFLFTSWLSQVSVILNVKQILLFHQGFLSFTDEEIWPNILVAIMNTFNFLKKQLNSLLSRKPKWKRSKCCKNRSSTCSPKFNFVIYESYFFFLNIILYLILCPQISVRTSLKQNYKIV